jgi:2',3'-cyclic-nucleotide 2'-phosphodiesterase (5'-nucleotidase family)
LLGIECFRTLGFERMIEVTESRQTTIGPFNSGAIRIDDILRETITQYDILRTLPFPNYFNSFSI